MSESFTRDLSLRRQGKGDHEIWFSPITNRHFVVNAVLKQAGISKRY